MAAATRRMSSHGSCCWLNFSARASSHAFASNSLSCQNSLRRARKQQLALPHKRQQPATPCVRAPATSPATIMQLQPRGLHTAGSSSSLRRRPAAAHVVQQLLAPAPLRRPLRQRLLCRASDDDIADIMKKYGAAPAGGGKPVPQRQAAPSLAPTQRLAPPAGNGVFLLLLLNVVLFIADHLLHLPGISRLYLNHAHPVWYQWLTHAFCHANFNHLSMNLFNLCVFGKLVEETEGAGGVVFTYIVTALGAAAAAVFTQPATYHGASVVSVGASGAIFGLFSVSVLTRWLSWDPRRLLEGAILGQFVVRQVLQEAAAQASGGLSIGGVKVSHLAHLGGALAGVLLVFLLSRLPAPDDSRA